MAKPLTNDFAEQRNLINPAKPIFLYRNLHKDCFSVKQGTVKFHTQDIWMSGCYFPVNERLRLKVIRDKQKNVHAYIKGYLTEPQDSFRPYLSTVTYNPYMNDSFVTYFGQIPVRWAKCVHAVMDDMCRVFAYLETKDEKFQRIGRIIDSPT